MQDGLLGSIKVALELTKLLERDMLSLDTFGLDQLFKYIKGELMKSNKRSFQGSNHGTLNQSNVANRLNTSQIPANSNIVSPKGENVGIQPSPGKTGNVYNFMADKENQPSIISYVNETSEIQYHFKDLDIEDVLENARRFNLSAEKLTSLAKSYTEKTDKKLPELYEKLFCDYSTYLREKELQEEFQREVDYIIMRTELNVKISNEIVISNLLVEDMENSHILKDIIL